MDVEVIHEPQRDRFTVIVDGAVAGFAQYRERPGVVSFVHTEIDPARQGQGLASRLIAYALQDARDRELAVLPHCSFVREYVVDHPEFQALVPEDRRAEFGL
jgi:predicted GNAT family acetyltransferase